MILANHTLKQLNIIDDNGTDSKKNGNLSSVASFLNKCCSSIGSRKFETQILNPTNNIEWLNNEYSIISELLLNENNYLIDFFRKQIKQIFDIEKLSRQLVLKRLYPSSIYKLYKSIEIIKNINVCLYEKQNISQYLCNDILIENNNCNNYIDNLCSQILKFLDESFIIENCKSIHSVNIFDENIIKPGVSSILDDIYNHYNENNVIFNEVKNRLNIIIKYNGNTNNSDTDYIKIHETDKLGMTLQITKSRANILKKVIKQILDTPVVDKSNKSVTIENPFFEFHLSDIKFSSISNTMDEIEILELNKISKEILHSKEKLNNVISNTYFGLLQDFENKFLNPLEELVNYIAKIDVIQSKAYIAKIYNYCKPEIENTKNDKSYVNAYSLRHCLIEHLQQNEIYVTNDVMLGNDKDGILLFGTNAVGKTSLIRALGISVIMAQSGMFVPCSRFLYYPYSAIYSRILGNDNIFKGLSTFAVEMSELRIILKMADKNSLILGDELCSGTETESALSIFVAGLMDLHEKNSTFIFATHFHEIIKYDEIKNLTRLQLNHMEVYYDRERDCLVYDRKLKEGTGTKTYGLEVCKSLYLSDVFLEKAYAIRNKYFPETKGELSQVNSVYNSKKIKGICEYCKENISEEVHHLEPQKKADENGYINSFHKNHKANLLLVCEKCHNHLHYNTTNDNENTENKTNTIVKRKKTTKGYKLL